MSRAHGRRAGAVLGAGAIGALLACVEIQTGPGVLTSVRLDPVPAAVIAGDTLRDSLGLATRLRLVAFDRDGDTVTTDGARFYAIPIADDTTTAAVVPVTVDSLAGTVIASATLGTVRRARLVARLGPSLQLVDTIEVVGRPTALGVAPSTGDSLRTLHWFCTDARTTLDTARTVVGGDTIVVGTATAPAAARLTRDSAGTTVGVPRFAVDFALDAGRAVPVGRAPHGNDRPALYLTRLTADAPIRFDTTGADGIARVRVRVVPTLLPRATWPDTVRVRITARARTSATAEVPSTASYVVRLVRRQLGDTPCP